MNILRSRLFWIIAIVIALITIFFAVAPKPIDMNLEKIGNGQNSVVFVYDPNLTMSNLQATEINKARELIGEQAIFLIAKIGDPTAQDFIKRYDARSLDLLFFNEQGNLIYRHIALLKYEELIQKLSGKSP